MSSKLMDELVVLKAARLCLTKDKELDQSLELQFQETLATLLSSELSTQVYDFQSVFPYNRNPYCYEKFNNDLYVRLRIS
jgi:DNA primase large subunit